MMNRVSLIPWIALFRKNGDEKEETGRERVFCSDETNFDRVSSSF
jgi:hypothetical protein